MTAHSLRHHAAIQQSLNPNPTAADSIVRVVGGMSLVETLRIMARIANDEKFSDSTYVFTERLDSAIADLLEEAEAEQEFRQQPDYREEAADRRWYVGLVS